MYIFSMRYTHDVSTSSAARPVKSGSRRFRFTMPIRVRWWIPTDAGRRSRYEEDGIVIHLKR